MSRTRLLWGSKCSARGPGGESIPSQSAGDLKCDRDSRRVARGEWADTGRRARCTGWGRLARRLLPRTVRRGTRRRGRRGRLQTLRWPGRGACTLSEALRDRAHSGAAASRRTAEARRSKPGTWRLTGRPGGGGGWRRARGECRGGPGSGE